MRIHFQDSLNFLRKLRSGKSETFYENAALNLLKTHKLK